MMALCVNLLEEFIALSDGMIVLASWNYFSRLWCVYEWVCGLLIHSAMEIEILADPFIRDSTVEAWFPPAARERTPNASRWWISPWRFLEEHWGSSGSY
ncbi:unnamed protein product [Durusdinium trenchii]|uniref:Uncharacterized protein n=2 Tax=Durusdinium trenchii TaxID=1381693 RepID=A0ABP0P7B3_9DINO